MRIPDRGIQCLLKVYTLSLVEIELLQSPEDSVRETGAEIETVFTAVQGKSLMVGKVGVRDIADGIFLLLTARLD